MPEPDADAAARGDLDEASVLAEARRRAGRDDFGDEGFREPLRVLLDALDREAGLHPGGRAAQRARIVESLVTRLRVQDHLERHPEILDEELGAPVVVVGLARTGTTMLQRLLASDPDACALLWWEARSPAPFPGSRWRERDPRVADARRQVRQILEAVPELAAIHPWDPEGPDEEILLLEHTFLSLVPESGANLPGYRAWLTHQDLAPGYAYLKRLLQFLQWQKRESGRGAGRWVLKSPCHLAYLERLFETFPGARVIQTHRDPLETIPSVASLYSALWRLASDRVDEREVGRQCMERWSWALERCLRARDAMPGERFFDVWYREVGADPMAAVRRIYAFLGRALTRDAESAMRRWTREHARERRAAHEYTLERFGLTRDTVERAFAEYRERFIVGRAEAG